MSRKKTFQAQYDDEVESNEYAKPVRGGRKQKYPAAIKPDSFSIRTRMAAKTHGQEFYLNTLEESTITLCQGPAGCGKTWLMTRYALELLMKNEVDKITVTKPIIEAGNESLGYLPGTVEDKVLPHFQSIIDCFEDHLGPAVTKKLIDTGKITFLPIAFMRGRNFNNSFVIVDESQNLTRKGIKLIMTRIGAGSVMVLNGDTDQIDLPNPNDSGLAWAISCLRGKSSYIGVAEMNLSDVQRHPLIETILSNLR